MFRVDAQRPVHFCDGLTRRDFLHAGSLVESVRERIDWVARRAEAEALRV